MTRPTRRDALKYGGIATGTGLLTSFAGCTGSGGSGGSGGGDSGGSGGSGGGSSGGSGGGGGGDSGGGGGGGQTQQQEMQDIALGMPPWGPYNIFIQYANEQGLWDKEFSEAGYNVDVQSTWEDANLFASGQTQFSMISTIEAASIGEQLGQELTTFGQQAVGPHGYIVQKDGPYDTDKTGSVQASLDKIVEEEATFALGSWAAGSLPYGSFAIQDLWGYDLSEGGDFNVTIVDYGAMPSLLNRGELAVIANSPLHGAADGLLNDDFEALWWDMNLWKEEYGMVPPLGNMIMTSEYYNNNKPAARAMLRVYKQAVGYIADNVSEIAQKDYAMESMPVESVEAAEMVMNWAYNGEGAYSQPAVPPNPEMTSDVQESNRGFMDRAAQIGMTQSNWSEFVAYDHLEADA